MLGSVGALLTTKNLAAFLKFLCKVLPKQFSLRLLLPISSKSTWGEERPNGNVWFRGILGRALAMLGAQVEKCAKCPSITHRHINTTFFIRFFAIQIPVHAKAFLPDESGHARIQALGTVPKAAHVAAIRPRDKHGQVTVVS